VKGFGCRPHRPLHVHEGRRPKASKERNRDGGTLAVPRYGDLSGAGVAPERDGSGRMEWPGRL